MHRRQRPSDETKDDEYELLGKNSCSPSVSTVVVELTMIPYEAFV